jgi:uncharacterized membrane protein HdeD (DUF308 family)
MLKSLSSTLILRGILAVVIGIIAVAWPGVTILALVILFAVFVFMDAGFQGLRAFSGRKAGPVIGHLLLLRHGRRPAPGIHSGNRRCRQIHQCPDE